MNHKNFTLLAVAAALLAAASAPAQDNYMTNPTGGNWGNSTIWSLGVPTSAQDVFHTNVTASTVGITVNTAAQAKSLTIGGSGGSALLSAAANQSLTVGGNITLASGAGGAEIRLGATNFTLTLNGGGGSIINGGGAGTATINVQGGFSNSLGLLNASVDDLNAGASSSGTLIITNGQTYNVANNLRINNVSATANSTGILQMDGGTLNMSGANGIRFNTGAHADNRSYLILNSNATVKATAIERVNLGTDAAIQWNDGTIGNYAGTNLTISAGNGTMNIILAGTGTHTFEVDSGQSIAVNATAVLADKAGENGTLTKAGLGTLTLNGTNTYTGSTSINAGTVVINTASALGNGGNITFGGGGLQYGTGITTDLSSRLKNSNSAILIDTNNNNVAFGSAIDSSNAGGLTKNGTGMLILNGSNSYTGTTTVNTGTLATSAADRISDSSAVTVASGALLQLGGSETVGSIAGAGNYSLGAYTLTAGADNTSTAVSGVLSGAGGGLTKSGTGTLTLNGSNTYTGASTINAGTVVINNASALGSGGNITFGGGGLQYGTGITTDLSSRIKNSNSAILINTNNNLTFASAIDSSNIGGLTKNGTGTLTLTGNNTYTGLTTISSGNLSLANTAQNNSTISGDILVLTGGTLATTSASSHQIADTSNITISGGTYNAGSRTDTIASLTLTSGNLTKIGQTLTTTAASVFSGGAIQLSTGATLSLNSSTFNGTAVTLSGNITRLITSGTTTLGTGSFVYNDAISSDAARGWYLSGDVYVLPSAMVNLTNANTGIGGLYLFTTTRVFDVGSASDMNIGWSISGSAGTVGLTKNGTGTLTLSGNNTYTGATTINAGTLQITSTGLLGGGSYSGNIANSGALIAGSNSNQILSGIISGTGALTKNGTGTLTLSGVNTYTGATTINTGALTVTGGSAIADTGAVSVASGAVFNLGASETIGSIAGAGNVTLGANTLTTGSNNSSTTLSGVISGANGALTKSGTGTLTLTGNNTYTGATTVNAGTLQAAATGALANSTVININGGSFLVTAQDAVNDNAAINLGGGRMAVSGTFDETVGALTLSANSVIDLDGFSGILRFDGVGSWASDATLAIWNWSGTTQYGTQINNYANPSHVVFTDKTNLTDNLGKISFYSGSGTGFIGNAFEESFSQSGFATSTEIIAVPEPETYFYAVVLIAGLVVQYIRRRAKRKSLQNHHPKFATRAAAH